VTNNYKKKKFDFDAGMEITKRNYEVCHMSVYLFLAACVDSCTFHLFFVQAAIDNPACCVWEELMEQYPDAVVILTLHPKGPEQWYESCYNTIYQLCVPTWSNYLAFQCILPTLMPFFRKVGKVNELFWDHNLKGTMRDKKQAVAEYIAHIEDVKAKVPKEKLLIFKPTEGWGPLCKILGKEVPTTPFPNTNNREEISALFAKFKFIAFSSAGAALAAVGGIAYYYYSN
jgi:hypothetical protein